MVSNSAKLDRRTKQHTQFGVSVSNGSSDMARTKSWRKKRKKKKNNNEANWMVSNSAKLDCRTKQHTQSGVSTSDGSRDMAQTKSWRKKKINNKVNWMVSNSAKLINLCQLIYECIIQRDRFSVALYATEERSSEEEKL